MEDIVYGVIREISFNGRLTRKVLKPLYKRKEDAEAFIESRKEEYPLDDFISYHIGTYRVV